MYEIKRNKPSLIQPKLGVCAKVCFAYMLVSGHCNGRHRKVKDDKNSITENGS